MKALKTITILLCLPVLLAACGNPISSGAGATQTKPTIQENHT